MVLFAFAANGQTPVAATINGAAATLPPPPGMRSVDPIRYRARHPDFMTPPDTDAIAVFIPSGLDMADDPPAYAMVQVNNPPKLVPSGLIDSLRALFDKGSKDGTPNAVARSNELFAQSRERIADYYKLPDFSLRATGMETVSLIRQTPDLLAYSMYMVYELTGNGRTEVVRRPGLMMIVRLNGVATYFYYFGDFETSVTAPELSSRMRDWVEAVAQLNGLPAR
jgi:hypothetical protein